MSDNSLVLNFSQIDDSVEVHINGEPVYGHGILRHTDQPQQADVTGNLQNGRNDLRIVANNGPGSATLIGDVTFKGNQVVEWNFTPMHTGQGAFVDQTIAIMYHS